MLTFLRLLLLLLFLLLLLLLLLILLPLLLLLTLLLLTLLLPLALLVPSVSRAIEIQPLHPEARGLLGEVLGHSGDKGAMEVHIKAAEKAYDDMSDRDKISPSSLASVYHKLATTYLTVRMY